MSWVASPALVSPAVVVLSLIVEYGGRNGEARSWLWRSCTHKVYEFRPFSEEVTALHLGARRRSIELCVLCYTGSEPLSQRRGWLI